jgi:hypothetical protein
VNHAAVAIVPKKIVPPTIDSAPYRDHDSAMRTSRLYGMRERPINPAV